METADSSSLTQEKECGVYRLRQRWRWCNITYTHSFTSPVSLSSWQCSIYFYKRVQYIAPKHCARLFQFYMDLLYLQSSGICFLQCMILVPNPICLCQKKTVLFLSACTAVCVLKCCSLAPKIMFFPPCLAGGMRACLTGDLSWMLTMYWRSITPRSQCGCLWPTRPGRRPRSACSLGNNNHSHRNRLKVWTEIQ